MYNEFYGFSEKPFELTPDPKFLYLTPSHREALHSMIDGLRDRRGFISITGEVGTGKTTLIHSCLSSLDKKVKTVYIFHPTITFKELLETILWELDLEILERSKDALLLRLVKYSTQLGADETIAIIIDEAQSLPEEAIKEIQVFLDLVPKAIQVVLVGQPEFKDKLNSQGLRQLEQRIGSKHQIRALSEEESKSYIDHRLKLVGSSSFEVLTPEATAMICEYAQGIPRIINVLCDNAFLLGYSSSQKRIDDAIIREAIGKMEHPFSRESFLSHTTAVKGFHLPFHRLNYLLSRPFLIFLSFLCLGGFIFLINRYFEPKPAKTWDIKSLRNPYPDTQPPLASPSQAAKEENPKVETLAGTDIPSKASLSVVPPVASKPPTRELGKSKEIAIVKKGQNLSYLAQKYYNMVNTTLLALILDFNPKIINADHIEVDQKIRIPRITEELLIVRSADDAYKIHVGTFENSALIRFYKNELALKGKVVEMFPRKVSPEDTWYRVLVGPFGDKDECLKVIGQLKEKRCLPIFGGVPRME